MQSAKIATKPALARAPLRSLAPAPASSVVTRVVIGRREQGL
jgi:hypothetical protein